MTISEAIIWINEHPIPVITYMAIVPLLAFLFSMLFNKYANDKPFSYLFSILVYAAAIPGVLAIILSGYDFLFRKTDLKQVNIFVYFLPIISMIITVAAINRVVNMTALPGFKRFSGLLMIIGVTSVMAFILERLFIGVIFFGSVYTFLGLFLILFVAVKIGWEKLFE